MSAQRVQMEGKKIKVVKNSPKPKSVHDIQVFLGCANFYQRFIKGFNKIARLLSLILKTTIFTGLSTISQSSIDVADEEEIGRSEIGGNKTNLSNPSVSKKSTKAGYLTSRGNKKGSNNPKKDGGNTKKGVKAVRGSDSLTPDAKKAFNYLRYVFT